MDSERQRTVDPAHRVAELLAEMNGGNLDAQRRWDVVELIQGELRERLRNRLTRRYPGAMAEGSIGQFTAVLHDFFLRIVGNPKLSAWKGKTRDDVIHYSCVAIENLVIDHLRRKRLDPKSESALSMDAAAIDDVIRAQTRVVEAERLGNLEMVLEALHRMEEVADGATVAQVLRLKLWGEMTHREIAEAVGLRDEDASRRLFRFGLDRLRELVGTR